MLYLGKYVDRFPEWRAAGKVVQRGESSGDALTYYPLEEAAEAAVKGMCRKKMQETPHIRRNLLLSTDDGVKKLLTTELGKTSLALFSEKYLEDLYCSRPPLGKTKEYGTKPSQITNENTIFGKPVEQSEPLYELILPNKSPERVNREYCEWHNKYKLSHKHYFPSERIDRNYDRKYFNPNGIFGKIVVTDPSGVQVKKCLTECKKVEVTNRTQKKMLDKTVAELGKSLQREKLNLPEDTTFGIKTAIDACNAQDLIENITDCKAQNKLMEALAHINQVRHALWERRDFYIGELRDAFQQEDSEKTGYISFSKLLEIARSFHIILNKKNVWTVVQHFKFDRHEDQEDERVDIDGVWKLLNLQTPLPPIMSSLSPMPSVFENKETTYRLLCADLTKKPHECAEVEKHLEETLENAKTTAYDCIMPDTPMLLGILPSEFTQPRSKDMLRRLFKSILSDDFDMMWSRAQEKLKTPDEQLSINQLLSEMEDYRESKIKGSMYQPK